MKKNISFKESKESSKESLKETTKHILAKRTSQTLVGIMLLTGTNSEALEYEVQSKDTLSKIANKFQTNIKAILEKNPQLENPNIILTGHKIKIPNKHSGEQNNEENSENKKESSENNEESSENNVNIKPITPDELNLDYELMKNFNGFNEKVSDTLNWAQNDKNPIQLTPQETNYLRNILKFRLLELLKSTDKLEYLTKEINKLKDENQINFNVNFSKNIKEIFDDLCTLERILLSRRVISIIEGNDFFDRFIKKYNGDGGKGLLILKKHLKLKSLFSTNEKNFEKLEPIIDKLINKYEKEYNIVIKKELICALFFHESGFNIFNVGPTGDYGLGMNSKYIFGGKNQFHDNEKRDYIHEEYKNPLNPKENIERTIEHIAYLKKRWLKYEKYNYNIDALVLMSYNAGEGNVKNAINKYGKSRKQYFSNNNYLTKIQKALKKVQKIFNI